MTSEESKAINNISTQVNKLTGYLIGINGSPGVIPQMKESIQHISNKLENTITKKECKEIRTFNEENEAKTEEAVDKVNEIRERRKSDWFSISALIISAGTLIVTTIAILLPNFS